MGDTCSGVHCEATIETGIVGPRSARGDVKREVEQAQSARRRDEVEIARAALPPPAPKPYVPEDPVFMLAEKMANALQALRALGDVDIDDALVPVMFQLLDEGTR